MRVVLVVDAFPRRSEAFITEKAVRLAARGHDVHVLAHAPADHELPADLLARTHGRLTVGRMPTGGDPRQLARVPAALAAAYRRDPDFVRRLVTVLRRRHGRTRTFLERLHQYLVFAGLHPDVVHIEFAHVAARSRDLLEALACPALVSCRGSDLRVVPLTDPKLGDALREMFALVDRAVCVSQSIGESASELGLPRDKLFVEPPGVDVAFFRAHEPRVPRERGAAVRLVTVGRPVWLKGHEYLLSAVAVLRARGHDVRATLVGTATPARASTGELEYAVQDLGLTDAVTLTPPCDRDSVRQALDAADVFVLPSLSEGLNNATLEAMAMGLPVVVTDVGGMREAVRDGIDGFVVRSRDSGALADAIEQLVVDPARAAAMGTAGARRARECFDVRAQTDAYVALYDELSRRRDRVD